VLRESGIGLESRNITIMLVLKVARGSRISVGFGVPLEGEGVPVQI
jgi:hypothetical protein